MRKLGLVFVLIAIFGCEKARVDEQMYELCRTDAGIHIFETVRLPIEQFRYGGPAFMKTWNTSGGGYRFVSDVRYLKSSKPTLQRNEFSVVRESDNKTLGTYVNYMRIGGDIFWRPGPDSSNVCPSYKDGSEDENQFFKQLFLVQSPA